ncbi:hypothetical protein GCM10007160_07520 [Litchfieldella qijiaojingensis]|uniref:ATP-grasp domain-containing protein n=1 Tax=Litchfieldella qijiaojingensis TaxID=980347 RepID=A0ABQ2YG91_9GAMM|nr:D-alanine--D-alanine ligase [Halomonas qijiaojingensis]GGX82607.1 hypothetical protein GCM10007160_07520 [Halomonas qijiaojingensis]
MPWNVFVIGYEELGKQLLLQLKHAQDYVFHGLLTLDEVVFADEYPFDRLVADAVAELERFPGAVDAIVGYWDFPTSALAPVLRHRLGLRGPTLEAVLKCEHKFWSRIEQSRSVPECVPPFQAVDPFATDAVEGIHIDYPFWIKPVTAHSSHLGFQVDDAGMLREVLPMIKGGIGRFGKPFEQVMARARVPDEIATVTGHYCVVESIISAGLQCTLEGYVQNGEVFLTGVVDSVRDRRHPSVLSRYEYPSRLPESVQQRMFAYTQRFIERIGYDDAPFNIEFYHDPRSGRLWLLEINARLSRSHAALFHLVDGAPHFQVMVDVALGIAPRMPHRQGRYPVAAKQMIRVFQDGVVRRVPSTEEIRRVEQTFPGTKVDINVREGMRLSDLLHQDSFSYELGALFVGAYNRRELRERIIQCRKMLPFDIDPVSIDATA